MELELGIVENCHPHGCNVVHMDDRIIETRYSHLVQDRIQIRPGQLVALDMSEDPARIMWRWVRVQVFEFRDGRVIVDDGKCQLISLSLVEELGLDIAKGDDVWVCNVGHDGEIHDRVIDGRPEHPEQLITYITPFINVEYGLVEE
ncbi:MAG: hypothetical protein GTO18_13160 [Anaerolineales bacterium]|nr:hypothetical protein [Anaerolineales bacterium]